MIPGLPWANRAFSRLEKLVKIDLRYLIRGGGLLAGSEVLVSILSLGLSVLIAQYVSKDIYGIYRYILSLATLSTAFSLTGMNSSITRAVAAGREGAFIRSLLPQARFALLQAAIVLAASGYYFYNGNLIYGFSLLAVAVLAPAASILNTYLAFLNGKRDFKRMAFWRVQNSIVSAAAMTAVILTSPTVLGMTLAYYASLLVTNAWCTWRTLRRYQPSSQTAPDDITYGKHLSVMGSIGIIATQLDAIIIYQLLGPVALATYSFAILIPERLRSLLGLLANISLPKLAVRSDMELRWTAKRRTILGLIVSGAIAGLYALLVPLIFHVFFPQYLEAIPYSQLASLFALAIVPVYLSTALTAQGSKRALYMISISAPLLKIALTVVGVLTLGLWGAIAARILAGTFSGAISYVYLVSTGRSDLAGNDIEVGKAAATRQEP